MDLSLVEQEFISQAVFRMEENTPRIRKCLLLLDDKEVWQKPNSEMNSIGNLVLHLCGNITQYIISSLGNNPDNRIRDLEFSATGGLTRDELKDKITDTVTKAVAVMMQTTGEELTKVRMVQGFQLSGIGIIMHVVEHYSYHTGQIAFWTKQLKQKDLGFYKGVDLNVKNEK